jgi:tRNA dimethylallyltransferase
MREDSPDFHVPAAQGCTQADASQPALVAILGPTGSGKSDLALEIAQNFRGEIVNCDSLQVYRYFDIGTAKLPTEARRGIPHHLIDLVVPNELFTAGEYARLGRRAISEITGRGNLPVIAGGTGFYLRALLEGLFEGPARDQELRERLAHREESRPGSIHRLLSRFDAETARKIHPHDLPKVTRALEVCLIARRPVSELFRQGREPLRGYRILKIGLLPDRADLYQHLDTRCHEMFQAGLIDETRRILAMGFSPASKPFESHGYKQAFQLINAELTLKEAVNCAQRNTRRYAKRQITWFRRETGLKWINEFGNTPQARAAAFALVRTLFTSPCKDSSEHF